MRKTLIIVAAMALALVPVTAAQASTKHYKISYAVSPTVIDVSPNHDDRATVSGRVTGGPVKGRSVHLYATNTNDPRRKRVDLHTVKLSSSGKFKKSWHPPRGGRWVFTATRPTYGSYRGTSVATKYVDAFEFVDISRFYQGGKNNLPAAATPLVGTVPGHVERLKVAGGALTTFGVEYFVQGGASAVFNVSGYRCKKISMHLGISNVSRVSAGTYETKLDTTRLASYSGARTKSDYEQTGTYTVTGHFNKVTIQVDPSSVRVLVGNPKVFCTYPFTS